MIQQHNHFFSPTEYHQLKAPMPESNLFLQFMHVSFVCLFSAADMETAPSSTRSEWATTIPWSRRSTRRSTPWIRSSSTRAITPTATTMTWPWCACRRECWATRQGSACRSVVTFSPPVCQWRRRGCWNRPATVTSPVGVTQVRAAGTWRGAGHCNVSVDCRAESYNFFLTIA